MTKLYTFCVILSLVLCTIDAAKIDFNKYIRKASPKFVQRRPLINVKTLNEWNTAIVENDLSNIVVSSNVSHVSINHPTMKLIKERLKANSKPSKRSDKENIALCIEGGGMRGCVSAGASLALSFLGLNDVVDIVYGSSAGAMIGTYFIGRQYSGNLIYYDILPQAGTNFIDKSKILDAAGIPSDMVNNANRLRSLVTDNAVDKVIRRTIGRVNDSVRRNISIESIPNEIGEENIPSFMTSNDAVINLRFLLDGLMGDFNGLDWETFERNENLQPLRIVTSCVKDLDSKILSRKGGHYTDKNSLLNCIRASMLVPGVTGPLLALHNGTQTPLSWLPSLQQPSTRSFSKINVSNSLRFPTLRYPKFAYLQSKAFKNAENSTVFYGDNNTMAIEIDDGIIPITASISRTSKVQSKRTIQLLQDWISRKTSSRLPSIQPQLSSLARYRNIMNFQWRWKFPSSNSENKAMNESISMYSDIDPKTINDKELKRKENFSFSLKLPMNRFRTSSQHLSDRHKLPNHEISSRIYTSSMNVSLSALLCDAFLCEPIPYRSAVREGATHCIVLRTRPDPCRVLGKGPGPYEQIIARRYFHQYNATPAMDWLNELQHYRIYAEDVLLMNEAAFGPTNGVRFENYSTHILPIAVVGDKEPEIGQLETRREKIYEGLRSGARRVLEVFLPLILSLDEYPSSISLEFREKLKEWRSNQEPFGNNADVSVEYVLELIFPISSLQVPSSPLPILYKQLPHIKGNPILTDTENKI